MGNRRRLAHEAEWRTAPVQRRAATALVPAAGPAHAAVARGLDPGILGAADRAGALGALGSAAGNAAVVALLQARTDHRLEPPGGIAEIRRVASHGTRGHTRMELPAQPPVFRAVATGDGAGGFVAGAQPVRVPEPDFQVRYPAPGRHVLYEGTTETGAFRRLLEVTDGWSAKLLQGESDHVRDQELAIDMTWGRVGQVINEIASSEPAVGATAEEAERAAWHRFVDALPAPLRPEGDRPTEEAQLATWGDEAAQGPFRVLLRESRVARDVSQWHTPSEQLLRREGDDEVMELRDGTSRIGTPTPEDLMDAAWRRLPGAGGGGTARRRRR